MCKISWKILWKHTALWALSLCTLSALAAPSPSPSTYPDITEIPPPVITIRSMFTGAPIKNGQYEEKDPKNVHWQLRDRIWQGKPVVQFNAVGTNKCLTFGTGVKDCEDQVITSFFLVPTDSGAFLLLSSIDGACLFSKNFGEYDLAQCARPRQLDRPVDLEFLWGLLPPFGQSRILLAPTK